MLRVVIYIYTIVTLAIMAALATSARAEGAVQPLTVALRESPVVEGPKITLGDLFPLTDNAATAVVARAPEPGRSIRLKPDLVASIAKRNGVLWDNAAGIRRITVTRASQMIAVPDIEEEIRAVLAQNTDAEIEVSLAGRVKPIHVSLDEMPSLAVDVISFDENKGMFRVSVRAPASAPAGNGQTLMGRFYSVTQVPVMRQTAGLGSVISSDDWEWSDMRSDRLPRDVILDPSHLVGMALKRTARAGQALRSGDVRRPPLVEKGDTVTMTYRRPGLELTATGRALQDGARNDMISLRNTTTQKMVEGRVTGPGRVEIGSPALQTAAR